MRNVSILFGIMTLIIFSSCGKKEISEEWSMVQINHGLSNQTTQIPVGEIIWNFNETYNELVIENSIGASTLVSGDYMFSLRKELMEPGNPNVEYSFIYIDDVKFGIYEENNDSLSISAAFVDGESYIFVKQ